MFAEEVTTVINDRLRLKLSTQFKHLIGMPVFYWLAGSKTIKPNHINLAIIGKQFGELASHISLVLAVVAHSIVGMMPVARGVIDSKVESGFMTGFR